MSRGGIWDFLLGMIPVVFMDLGFKRIIIACVIMYIQFLLK